MKRSAAPPKDDTFRAERQAAVQRAEERAQQYLEADRELAKMLLLEKATPEVAEAIAQARKERKRRLIDELWGEE